MDKKSFDIVLDEIRKVRSRKLSDFSVTIVRFTSLIFDDVLQCVLTDQRIKAIEQVHGYFSSEQVFIVGQQHLYVLFTPEDTMHLLKLLTIYTHHEAFVQTSSCT